MASDSEAFALAAERFPQVVELRVDHIVDTLVRRMDVISHVFADLVTRDTIPQLAPGIARPRRAPETEPRGVRASPTSA